MSLCPSVCLSQCVISRSDLFLLLRVVGEQQRIFAGLRACGITTTERPAYIIDWSWTSTAAAAVNDLWLRDQSTCVCVSACETVGSRREDRPETSNHTRWGGKTPANRLALGVNTFGHQWRFQHSKSGGGLFWGQQSVGGKDSRCM